MMSIFKKVKFYNRSVIVWDQRNPSKSMATYKHQNAVEDISFNSDTTKLASASGDDTAIIYDQVNLKTHRVLEGHSSNVFKVSFNNTGTKLLTGSWDSTCKLWDVETGSELQTLKGNNLLFQFS